LRGSVAPEYIFLTSALVDERNLELQVTCTVSVGTPKVLSSGKRLRVPGAVPKCTIEIILYGPPELAESICEFIEDCNEYLEDGRKLYLQDPAGCDRNVPYRNPQRLPPLDDSAPDTLTLNLISLGNNKTIGLEDIEPRPELLELLDSQEDLPEAPQPPAIATTLERYVPFPSVR
jgi:SWI/SNF-related matrix-associated actin-dependent regulator of chromatin subfamily A3